MVHAVMALASHEVENRSWTTGKQRGGLWGGERGWELRLVFWRGERRFAGGQGKLLAIGRRRWGLTVGMAHAVMALASHEVENRSWSAGKRRRGLWGVFLFGGVRLDSGDGSYSDGLGISRSGESELE
ncbi:hypothetical protein Ancab_032349 [Ancistrocladus abbreviatus]